MSTVSKKVRINNEIRVPKVRLIGADGEQVGVVAIAEAQTAAEQAGLDLVEISPNAEPPVCRVMDYNKFIFEEKKRKADARKKQKQVKVKEIKFRPGTEEGDYQVKLRNLTGFLENGDKVKLTVRFRGREMAHKELGMKLLERLRTDFEEIAVIEQHPKLEGRQLIMVIAPKKKK